MKEVMGGDWLDRTVLSTLNPLRAMEENTSSWQDFVV